MPNIIQPGVASDRGLPGEVLAQVPMGDIAVNPGKGYGLFDDFILGPTAASAGTTLPPYIATAITTGTLVPGNELGGSVVFTPSGTENHGIQIQTTEFVKPDDGQMIAFGARVKLLDADQMDVYVGLGTADTDVAQSVPNDAIGFKVSDASANILYYAQKDGTGAAGTDTGADAEDATYVVLEALVTGEEKVEFFVDNVLKATYDTVANIVDDEELAMTIACVAGEAVANTLHVDWMYCYQYSRA